MNGKGWLQGLPKQLLGDFLFFLKLFGCCMFCVKILC